MPVISDPVALAGIRWEALPSLLLLSLAIMGSPGPVTVSLVGTGSARGLRRSLPFLAGAVTGTLAVLLAVATGVTGALLAVPRLATLLGWIAAAYVLWLAYRIATAPPLTDPEPTTRPPSFGGGLLLGIANPKAWIAIAAVFASVRLSASAAADGAAKTVVLSAMVVVICTGWLVAGRSLAPLLREPRRARAVNVLMALAVVAATAVGLLR